MGNVWFEWHKLPELPPDDAEDSTLFLIYYKYLYTPPKTERNPYPRSEWIDIEAFCLYSAEEGAFFDFNGDEYAYTGTESADGTERHIETWWTYAADPKNVVDEIHTELVENSTAEPWRTEYEETRERNWFEEYLARKEYEADRADEHWKRLRGE